MLLRGIEYIYMKMINERGFKISYDKWKREFNPVAGFVDIDFYREN